MTAPPRPEWLGAVEVVPGCNCAFCKAKAYIEHLERELESAEAKLDELRREPETMWGWP